MLKKIFAIACAVLSTATVWADDDFNPSRPPEPNPTYKLTVKAEPADKAYTSGNGRYAQNQEVYVNSSASDSDWEFKYWLRDGNIVETSRGFYFTMPAEDVTFTAVYQLRNYDPSRPDDPYMEIKHRLYLSCEPDDACSFNLASGSRQTEDQSVRVAANPSQGFEIEGWYYQGEKIAETLSFDFLMPKEDASLVAKFVYNPGRPGDPTGDQTDVDNPYVAVTDVLLNTGHIEIYPGETYQLTATVKPDDATNPTVKWSVDDATVATVSQTGLVTAVAYGETTVYAQAGDKVSTCTVKVAAIAVESVTMSVSSLTLRVGQNASLSATVLPDNAADKTLTWSSSADNVAVVDEAGNVTAVGIGEATIYATANNGVRGNCVVTVEPTPVSSITLDIVSATITICDSKTLTATILPEDATDKTVTWSSSDTAIATVDANGTVSAVGVGNATITATASNGLTATCAVTVVPVLSESITLSATTLSLVEGDTETLVATILPENTTDKTVTWSSSDTAVATVDANGTVTAVAPGTVIITAVNGDCSATCAVTVAERIYPVESVTLSDSSINIFIGAQATITATVLPENATNKTLTWASSNTAVATVDNGVVNAIAIGEATITATANNGVSASCTVSVIPIPSQGITLNKTAISLTEGESETLVATVLPEDATDKTVAWTSNNPSVATVDENGKVTAVAQGTAIITATNAGNKATCTVTVVELVIDVESITLNENNIELKTGEVFNLVATVLPENATNKTVTWSSSDPAIASVNADGKVTAIAVGDVTISAKTSNGLEATCQVAVRELIIEVESVTLSVSELTLYPGQGAHVTATIAPANATDKNLTWTSSNSAVATVDENGNITAVAEGEAVITAKASNGVSANCAVTVLPIPSAGITLNKTALTLLEGESETLIATVLPEDAADKTVNWSTSDASVATVDENGLVTAVAAGNAVITATNAGNSATCQVTVRKPDVESVTLDITEYTMRAGETVKIEATIAPDNAADKTITWTSNDTSVAYVDENGVVTAISVGEATINAIAVNGVSASCLIIVEPTPVESVTLNAETLELKEGETFSLIATLLPENATDKTVVWSSSDFDVATVDARGTVNAVKEGTAIISASAGDCIAECVVTVLPGSGITDALIDPDGDAPVYNLHGIRQQGKLRPGIYINARGEKKAIK